jgi:hypothetical protein
MQADKILDIASRVSTPLAVAGLVVGVLLIIFYAILKLKIFPKFNQNMGKAVISSMMKYLYRLAMVSVVLGFIAYLTPVILGGIYKPPKQEAFFDIGDGWTLRGAIEQIASGEGRTVRINSNCPEPFMKGKLRKGMIQGRSTSDLLQQLQYRLVESIPNEIYRVELTTGGFYDVDCKK